jgi:hypothetical protein
VFAFELEVIVGALGVATFGHIGIININIDIVQKLIRFGG